MDIRIILDTDIGPDCDDAAALALCGLYARRGKIDLLGVVHCTSSPWGVGAIRAINRRYGVNPPVGTLEDQDLLTGLPEYEKYNKPLSLTLPEAERGAQGAVALYRRLLAQSADHAIELVAIGPLRNLANLLNSKPDAVSPLNGVELVAKKVRRLTTMAGVFPGEGGAASASDGIEAPAVEWNVAMDIPSARLVAQKWPTQILFCGFGVGIRVMTGGAMTKGLPSGHPVREAYCLYTGGEDRPSWDLMTVMHILDPEVAGQAESAAGIVTIDEAGVTHFEEKAGGTHRYLMLSKPAAQAAKALDSLLLQSV